MSHERRSDQIINSCVHLSESKCTVVTGARQALSRAEAAGEELYGRVLPVCLPQTNVCLAYRNGSLSLSFRLNFCTSGHTLFSVCSVCSRSVLAPHATYATIII